MDLITHIKAKVAEKEQAERDLNVHLGYAPEHLRGSLTVSLRWDMVKALVEEVARLKAEIERLKADFADDVENSAKHVHCDRCQAEVERLKAQWIPAHERMPDSNVPVLATVCWMYDGKIMRSVIRAQYARPMTLLSNHDADDGEYDEATDEYYVHEGWYETNRCEETHWRVAESVSHWMPLPKAAGCGVGRD